MAETSASEELAVGEPVKRSSSPGNAILFGVKTTNESVNHAQDGPSTKRAATGELREVKHINGTSSSNSTSLEHATTNGTSVDGTRRRIALKRGPDVLDAKDLLPKGLDGGPSASYVSGSSLSGSAQGSKGRTGRQVTFQAVPENRVIKNDEQEISEDDAEGGDNDDDVTADGGDVTGEDDATIARRARVNALMSKYPESFVTAEDVVFIRLVRRAADAGFGVKAIDDTVSFKPPWTDVHLGEASALFGYKKLRIDIAYTAGWLHCYVGNTEEESVSMPDTDPELSEVMNGNGDSTSENAADPTVRKTPLQKIMGFYPGGTTHDLEEFKLQMQQDANFSPFGTLVTEYEAANAQSLKSMFCVYTCPITHGSFLTYFQRMQTLTLWFVDAAQYIDANESGWQIYTVYEKYEVDGRVQYGLVGYCNTYNFPVFTRSSPNRRRIARGNLAGASTTANGAHASAAAAVLQSGNQQPPETHAVNEETAVAAIPTLNEPKIRRRIAQFLILPPFQRRGHGVRLLDAIQRDAIANPNVISVSVEEAVPELTRMRLCVGAWQILEAESISNWLAQTIEKGYVTRDDVRLISMRMKLPLDVTLRCVQMLLVRVLGGMERDEDAVEILKHSEAQLITKEVEVAQQVHRRLKMGMVSITTDNDEEQIKVRAMWLQNVKHAITVATTRFRELPEFADDRVAVLKGLNDMMERCYCDKLGMSICAHNGEN